MKTAALPVPADLEARALTWADRARALRVDTAEHYTLAAALLQTVKALRTEVDATFTPICEKAHATWKEALAQRKKHDEPLVESEAILKHAMLKYTEAEERRQQAERAALEEQARAAEEQVRLDEAAALEAAGETAMADAVLSMPSIAPPVTLAPVAPRVAGIARRTVWKAQVTDLRALVAAVAAGTVPLAALQANDAVLQGQARSLKGELRWPGVRVFPESSIAAGRR